LLGYQSKLVVITAVSSHANQMNAAYKQVYTSLLFLTARSQWVKANRFVCESRLNQSSPWRGHDLVVVAEIEGHKRLESTRWYALPTKEASLDLLLLLLFSGR
jgi:hypothetical protein